MANQEGAGPFLANGTESISPHPNFIVWLIAVTWQLAFPFLLHTMTFWLLYIYHLPYHFLKKMPGSESSSGY